MSSIRDWLETLELGQFAEAFEAEDIDLAAARQLSDADLKELGLTMGPRRKVLAAIAELASIEESDLEPVAQAAERRQLTVMFCDLVGSTKLSEALDPEDLRNVMAVYRKAAADVVARYDGQVAQYLGDGVMAYFGWPRAHEDDGERAVRAALDIVDALKAVEAPSSLHVRISIATGPVVVGEGAEDDADANRLAVGETPNLAARLQGLAGPDQIVIGPGTHQLIGGAFDYYELGPRKLKGIVEPVPAWRVKGASAAEGRFEARTAGGLTPFVGRDAEIKLLLERWQQAKDGEGQVVLLQGEPGIGKSRITQVFRERLADEPHIRLRYQCSPYYVNSAFYPIIDQLERAAGFDREDAPDQKLDKLEAALAQGTDDVAKVAPLIAAILSLSLDRYPPLNLSPQRQKDDTIAALAAQVIGLARQQSVLLVFEDAHWCDPSTLETLTALIGGIQAAPVLIVITYRPEFEPPWTGHGHVVAQSLSRLGRRQGAEMVSKVIGDKSLPDDVLGQIVAKTDGVPLFVEELTKTVLEAGFLKDAGDHYELDGPLPSLAIPATLRDSLMARLDRLSPVKEVAQIGACIGRDFSHELLAAVSHLPEDKLDDALQQLINSELVFRRAAPHDTMFTFRHALVRDAAYGSLLKSRRQQLHRRIAESIEQMFSDISERTPELLAHHYTEASLCEPAAKYWLEAGRRATQRSANVEAATHLRQGLKLISLQPDTVETKTQELDFQLALGSALIATSGITSPDAADAYQRASELCETLEDPPQLSQVMWALGAYTLIRGECQRARATIENFLDRAEREQDVVSVMGAQRSLGFALMCLGDFDSARDHLERAVALYDYEQHSSLAVLFGQDPGVGTLSALSWVLWPLGFPKQALAKLDQAFEISNRLNHPHTHAYALSYASIVDLECGNIARAHERSQAAMNLSIEYGFPIWLTLSRIIRGEAAVLEGRTEEGIEEIRKGIADQQNSGTKVGLPGHFCALARALAHAGRNDDALATVADALAMVDETDERRAEAELYRVRGELWTRGPSEGQETAETYLRKSLKIACDQSAKSWQLRAATSLARLWQAQGKTKKAHDLLFPVYDWFTEGFDTTDLKDAKALLEELR